jgi:protease-4
VASDLILREMELLADKIPVVVSMSDVAASGGYYISSKAAKIVAEPATITGSIGVVGGKLATRRFQQELLGISHDEINRGANADFFSALDPFSPAQEAQYLALMTRIYDIFVDHVAQGRAMSRAEVESVAGGRIWTGRQALEIGLVDEVGGLARAVEMVLEVGGHDPQEPTDLVFYPRPPSLLEMLTRGLSPFLRVGSAPFPVLPILRTPQALELPIELLDLLRPS